MSFEWEVTLEGDKPVQANDFVGGSIPVCSEPIYFNEGEDTKVISIMVAADSIIEDDETFKFSIKNCGLASNNVGEIKVTATQSSRNVVIHNDDVIVDIDCLSPISGEQVEGHTSDTKQYTFRIHRRAGSSVTKEFSLDWYVAPEVNNPAQALDFVGDFFPISQSSLEFTANELSKEVTILTQGNIHYQGYETRGFSFNVRPVGSIQVSSEGDEIEAGVIVGVNAVAHIVEDDCSVYFDNTQYIKGEENTHTFKFRILREGKTSSAVNVNWAIDVDGLTTSTVLDPESGLEVTCDVATADDFSGGVFPSANITFAANEFVKEITISINSDADIENHESFNVRLSNPDVVGQPWLGIGYNSELTVILESVIMLVLLAKIIFCITSSHLD